MAEYSIGFDFGSLSIRGLLVDVDTGEEIASAEYEYPHGIMTESLPDGTLLPPMYALEHPQDYLDGISACSYELLEKSGVSKDKIIGIGLDATASTVLPIDEDCIPLCFKSDFSGIPQAWMKLWKHHGGSGQAIRLANQAETEKSPWFAKYGNVMTSEWFLPKCIELAENAPNVYNAMYSYIEVADWIACVLTGVRARSDALAACNCCYRWDGGYPNNDYIKRVSPEADGLIESKFPEPHKALGEIFGTISSSGEKILGLSEGTPVSVPIIDSHASVCASGAVRSGDVVYSCGTSAVEILLSNKESAIDGIHINAKNASIPGLFSLGAGQCSVGDSFAWFVRNNVPSDYVAEAKKMGVDLFDYLCFKAELIGQGKSGLLALDWWNGVRTPYFRFNIGGCIFGLNINTRPEQIWLAMLEAHAFNVKKSIELFISHGHIVSRFFAAGGIPRKNPLLMQILADVLQMDVCVISSRQTAALGSAILGAAVARNISIASQSEKMKSKIYRVYHPNRDNAEMYQKLYTDYCTLSNKFGQDEQLLSILERLQS